MPQTKDLINELEYQFTSRAKNTACADGDCPFIARAHLHCRMCAEKRLANEIGAVRAGVLARRFGERESVQRSIETLLFTIEKGSPVDAS